MAGYLLTARHIQRALDAAASDDADVARALTLVGYPEPRRRPPGFATLVRVIVGQQVSVQAASTIYARLSAAMQDDFTPERLLRMHEATLRKAGLSRAKAHYARSLARAIASEALAIDALAGMPDDDAMLQIQAMPWRSQ